jgi:ribosomal protein S1
VVIREERNGDLVVSLKRLELAVAWQRLRQCLDDDVSVTGVVVATNRGGVIVEVENIRGFCPGSQLGQRVASFDELIGRTMTYKVGGAPASPSAVLARASVGCFPCCASPPPRCKGSSPSFLCGWSSA